MKFTDPRRPSHRAKMEWKKQRSAYIYENGIGVIGMRGVAASINRRTGEPHRNAREISRRLARSAA